MSADPNIRKLLEQIDMLSRANDAQCETIIRYSRRNAACDRELKAYRAMVGKLDVQASGGPHIKREGR